MLQGWTESADTPGILSASAWVELWVSWASGRLEFGTGSVVGSNVKLTTQDSDADVIDVNAASFSGGFSVTPQYRLVWGDDGKPRVGGRR
jgi:hypothetical protein